MALMVSISGIRGVVGSTLTPDVIIRYVAGFGSYCRTGTSGPVTVVVGRDGRITGAAITDMITSALTMSGINVMDIGICPTPTVQLAVEHEHAAGGIARHRKSQPDAVEWNEIHGIRPDSSWMGQRTRNSGSTPDSRRRMLRGMPSARCRARGDWLARHIAMVLDLPLVKTDVIRKRRFRVVVDCVNAAGGAIVPALLRELGCDVIEMACDVSGVFSHTPEPIPENLTGLAARVRSEHADLGIAVDPDVDRLVLINEKGEPYGEEYTIATVVDHVLEDAGGQRCHRRLEPFDDARGRRHRAPAWRHSRAHARRRDQCCIRHEAPRRGRRRRRKRRRHPALRSTTAATPSSGIGLDPSGPRRTRRDAEPAQGIAPAVCIAKGQDGDSRHRAGRGPRNHEEASCRGRDREHRRRM